ncbi:MAG: sulfatase/phosphatase domain-containing protein, partial [bacterium]
LVVSYPARFQRPRRIAEQVRHIDLMPTVVELAGVRDGGWREGTSLCALVEKGARGADSPGAFLPQDHTLCENTPKRARASKCIRTADWKLLVEPVTGTAECFDLRNDPKETVNLAGTGLAAEAALAAWMAKVPGVTMNGWRVAVIGPDSGPPLDVRVRPVGGRVTNIYTLTGGDDLRLDAAGDSSALTIGADPGAMRIMVFETRPADAPVEFEVAVRGKGGPGSVLIGKSGSRPAGESFILTQEQATGLPAAFAAARESRTPAVCLWWLAGESMRRPAPGTAFTDEERSRLRALGYLQ